MVLMPEQPMTEDDEELFVPSYTHHGRDWWHRDHPTFVAITGFFAGLAYVALVPALVGGLLTWMVGERAAQEAYLYVLTLLLLPLLLLAPPGTRRFGLYMLVGMVVTALVVVGVGWVTWLMLMERGAA